MDFDKLRNTISILEVVKSYDIDLKKVGRQYRGFSPFKQETNPSFFVVPDRNIFKCFSSGHGGDVIKFVSLMENVSYTEAAKILCERYNIPIDEDRKTKKDTLYFKRQVASYLSKALLRNTDSDAFRYLQKRFSFLKQDAIINIINKFMIGMWNSQMYKELVTLYSETRIRGLRFPKTEENSFIVLPVIENNKVLTFMFRNLDDSSEYKYIYSAEPDKSLVDVVYNYNPYDQSTEIYVTEGIFDAIALYGIGIKNVVSLLGLNINEKKLSKLNKYSVINLALDTDRSGYKTALKTAQYFMLQNKIVYIILNTPYKDVDEAIRAGLYDNDTIQHKKQLITTHIYTRKYKTIDSEAQYKQWLKKVISSIKDKDIKYLYNKSIYEAIRQKTQDVKESLGIDKMLQSLTMPTLKLALAYIVDVIDERERYSMLQNMSTDREEDVINDELVRLLEDSLTYSRSG
jgi:DNA primase catalytic core